MKSYVLRAACLAALFAVCTLPASRSEAQERPSFVDGYHGGVYGHYPLWCTRFFVDKLEEFPCWKINLEIEPETWDTVRMRTPEAYRLFREATRSPRVEFVNPAYGQPYCFNVRGESLIRHFEYGIAKLHSHFPWVRPTCYSSEEPCFTDCLPMLLRGFGFDYAVLKCPNTCWGGYMRGYGNGTVMWTAPSGDAIPAVPRYACEGFERGSTWQTVAWRNSDEYLAACRAAGVEHPVGMCLQDAGWRNGPWQGACGAANDGSEYVTWTEYFRRVCGGAEPSEAWRMTQEDILVNLMWGSRVLQRVAQQVRRGENAAVRAEKVDLMRSLEGGPAADSAYMFAMWRPLMLAQHHDCWIVPYNNVEEGRTWADKVEEWCDSTVRRASALSGRAEASRTFRVVNTAAAPRRAAVTAEVPDCFAGMDVRLADERGRSVPCRIYEREGRRLCDFEADAPAFGYSVYRFERGRARRCEAACSARIESGGRLVVENDIYRIEFDPLRGGRIASLRDKRAGGAETVDTLSERGFNTLRGYFYDEGRFISSADGEASVRVAELTPFRAAAEVEGTIAGHPFRQTVTLAAGDPVIDCSLRIDWRGDTGMGEYREGKVWAENRRAFKNDSYKLLLMFPAAVRDGVLHKNAAFSVCRSTLDDTFFDTWDTHKHNIVVDWADVTAQDGSHGMALMTDHTTSYAFGRDFPLSLTVQYSGKGLWGRDYPVDGPTEIRYALLPHSGDWRGAGVWSASDAWNEPLMVRAAEDGARGRSFVEVGASGYELSSARMADGEAEVRLFNAEGGDDAVEVAFGFPVAEATEVRLDSTPLRSLPVECGNGCGRVKVAVPRSGLVTLRVRPAADKAAAR